VSSAGATHSWVEAYLGELGWVAFDPTNNLEACDRHVRVAVGRDYADAPPTCGVYKGKVAKFRRECGSRATTTAVSSFLSGVPVERVRYSNTSLPKKSS
jgi:transglutaminase-like putative cysteine protease